MQVSRDQAVKGLSHPLVNDDAKAASPASTTLAASGKAVIILTGAGPLLQARDPMPFLATDAEFSSSDEEEFVGAAPCCR